MSLPYKCHYDLVSLYKHLSLSVHINAYLCGLDTQETKYLTKDMIEKVAGPLKNLKSKLMTLQRSRRWAQQHYLKMVSAQQTLVTQVRL